MDETPIKFDQERNIKGLLAIPKMELTRRSESIQRSASLSLRRSTITLIAFVCDDDAIQKRLPQVILGNHRLLPRRVAALHRLRDDSIYVLSRESGWNNSKLQCEILKLLGRLLSPVAVSHWFVLCADAHSAHIAPCVFEAACRAGVSLMVVPASMTHLFQPLDTHVFATLKYQLWKASQGMLQAASTGEFNIDAFMDMVCHVVATVLGKSYPRAFAACGLSSGQLGISKTVLHALEWSEPPRVAAELPSLQELRQLWPQGRTIPISSVFRSFIRNRHGHPIPPNIVGVSREKPSPATPPLRLRLRSASRLKIDVATRHDSLPAGEEQVSSLAAASSTPCPPPERIEAPKRSLPQRAPVGRRLLPRRLRSRHSQEQSLPPV